MYNRKSTAMNSDKDTVKHFKERPFFSLTREVDARSWSEITNYEAIAHETMGYSVVDFDQIFMACDQKLRFKVIATITWKPASSFPHGS
jgi:hypothetical protein